MIDRTLLKRSRLLLHRLERISADSPYAHRASGIRASLSKRLSRGTLNPQEIVGLLECGYQILEKAAGEIPDTNES